MTIKIKRWRLLLYWPTKVWMSAVRATGFILLSVSLLAVWPLSFAESTSLNNELQINANRALFNYQMNCQGCHTPTGVGGGLSEQVVPDLTNNLGVFLKTQIGREYLVRVPGSANSVLSDEYLAEVLNWMLVQYAGDSLNKGWQPYQAEEVGRYRSEPLYEVIEYRQRLIAELAVAE